MMTPVFDSIASKIADRNCFNKQHETDPAASASATTTATFNISGSSSKSIKAQRERRRIKKRESYIRSTGGTSTGDEEVGELVDFQQQDEVVLLNSSLDRPSDIVNSSTTNRLKNNPNSGTGCGGGSPRYNKNQKSPSDLDADDEDNQDYDTTSVTSGFLTPNNMVLLNKISNTTNNSISNTSSGNTSAAKSYPDSSNKKDLVVPPGGVLSSSSEKQHGHKNVFGGPAKSGLNWSPKSLSSSNTGAIVSDTSESETATVTKSLRIELNTKKEEIESLNKIIDDLKQRLLVANLENTKLKTENTLLKVNSNNIS